MMRVSSHGHWPMARDDAVLLFGPVMARANAGHVLLLRQQTRP